ncbi:hypermethylated in cancer 2 protein isoform X2 [Chiloscyllium plagiosum]|uniref:hypermethylated in cancer 2 protein isoform X2 n=1 Tax=Chiloscyllium plagiosum TaxID=36176 RepID=UPI001CB802C7|nr:hypermethylated in cancer 2 protein isoform X2 [Chiloscyllium plagiosum]
MYQEQHSWLKGERWLKFEELEVEMELPNHAKQLLLQLNQQRSKGFFCDVIIVVENALFRAHKNILAASSMYFKSLVLHDNLINLDTDMVNATIFRQILDFIYTGKLLGTDQASEQNFNALLTAASYLQLHDLAAVCRKKMKRIGKTLHGKLVGPGPGKPGRGHRLPSAPVIQPRYSGSPEALQRLQAGELHRVEVTGDELYLASSNKGNPHSLGQNGGTSKSSNTNNSTNSNKGEHEQMLGLDLSKKSPSVPPHMSQEDMQLGECSQGGSPHPASVSTTNSAPFEDGAANPHKAENSDCPERSDLASDAQILADTGQPKGFRLAVRGGAPWLKQEKVYGRPEGANCRDEGASLLNGVIMGPLVKSLERDSGRHFEHAVRCKEEEDDEVEEEEGGEEENGRECSEDSAQSGEEDAVAGGGGGGHGYRPGQDGFEPAGYGDNLYVCIPCGKGFPSSEQLNAHVESHTEEELYLKEEVDGGLAAPNPPYPSDSRPYKCSVCEKSYRDPSTLRQHEKTHWLSRPFPCNICGKMFTQRGTMTRHMRSHLGLKPFACEECGMRFTRQYRLTEHMRVHSGEKPYECQICGGKFTQQRNLISHMRMHTSPT